MKLIWGIFLTGLLFALPAHADTLYDVTGTATLIGSDVCGGTCVETLNFSVEFDEQLTQYGYALNVVSTSNTATGPLGPATISTFLGSAGEYVPVAFGPGTELDLIEHFDDEPSPFVPQFFFANLYSCGNVTCGAEFCPDYPAVECSVFSSIQSVTTALPAVPEPATWGLLALGLSVFIPLKLRRLLDGPRGLAV